MSEASLALITASVLALVLPGAALRRRQLDFSTGWKMAAIWVALFALTAMAAGTLRL